MYVASGGNEFPIGSSLLQDRLYLNDGKTGFTKFNGLPNLRGSNSAIAAHDIDSDGDLDLFVGGRQVPGLYGHTPESYLLINEGGKFTNQITELAPELQKAGMVTDALWMDIDDDKDEDLVIVGEWMPISFYQFDGKKLTVATKDYQMQKTNGWWNCIEKADIDSLSLIHI